MKFNVWVGGIEVNDYPVNKNDAEHIAEFYKSQDYDDVIIEVLDIWQTKARGTNDQEYQIYLACADDGKGGDNTRDGAPLKTYEEWLNS